ncbi:MAG: uracil-DNA glycosylase [Rickettsiaceae bacterium]|nr:MAG: uracil-DNA glycosylase [Rickettsiaceae bacterium]
MISSKLTVQALKWLKIQDIDYYCSYSQQHKSAKPKILNSELFDFQNKFKDLPVQQNNNESDIVSSARKIAEQANSIDELKNSVEVFEGCSLKHIAKNTVFCDGVKNAPLMLIGEAPGATEDKMGIPFCGESGQLLDNMMKSIGVFRNKNAYITNTVFWRPPANRPPTSQEIDICRPFVEKHIALAIPKLIILVGNTAATSLLGKNAGITKIRKEYYSYSNQYLSNPIPVIAIFHPAYLLRQPLQKKTMWYDLLRIKQFIEDNQIVI